MKYIAAILLCVVLFSAGCTIITNDDYLIMPRRGANMYITEDGDTIYWWYIKENTNDEQDH